MRSTKRFVTLIITAAVLAVLIAGGTAWAAIINGGDGNNTLKGTAGADEIYGKGGNDTIYGLAGNDKVDGGDGADRLYGGNRDQILSGDDQILGRRGNDRLYGGPGADRLAGGYGNDIISEGPVGDAAVDVLNGGPGDDELSASNGDSAIDRIRCGDGQDEVWVDSVDDVSADCEIVHKDPSLADVKFATPQSVEETMQLSERFNSKPVHLISDYDVAGEATWDVYTEFSETNPAAIEQDFKEQRLIGFRDRLDSIERMETEDKADMQPQVDSMQQAVAQNNAGSVDASEVKLSGDLEDLERLAQESQASTETGNAITEVTITTPSEIANHAAEQEQSLEGAPEEEPISEEDATLEKSDSPPPADAEELKYEEVLPDEDPDTPSGSGDGGMELEAGTWYPNVGYSIVGKSQNPGKRYTYQSFRWRNDTLGYFSGYEHDFKLNFNLDGTTYLSKRVNFWCFPHPKGRIITSTLPRFSRYIDTNYNYYIGGRRCDASQRAYTIGISYAHTIKSKKWYYNYIAMPKGRDRLDLAELEAQRSWTPSSKCANDAAQGYYSWTWCSFKRNDRPLVDRYYSKRFFVPSSFKWWER